MPLLLPLLDMLRSLVVKGVIVVIVVVAVVIRW